MCTQCPPAAGPRHHTIMYFVISTTGDDATRRGGRSSASAGLAQRECDLHGRSRTLGALEPEAAAERLDAILEAEETRASRHVRAAASVVGHTDVHRVRISDNLDVDVGGVGVLH